MYVAAAKLAPVYTPGERRRMGSKKLMAYEVEMSPISEERES